MVIVMEPHATEVQQQHVADVILEKGCTPKYIVGEHQNIIGASGDVTKLVDVAFMSMPGVETVRRISVPYKKASREWKHGDTIIELSNGVKIGGSSLAIMAGPCSVESEEQVMETARFLSHHGTQIFRGGVFKPRTSPYSFDGLGEEGLKLLSDVRSGTGMAIITELMDAEDLPMFLEYGVDIIQIGARNAQNYRLLRKLGEIDTPVFLKRGWGEDIDELLQAAEYILAGGNEKVMVCERGIRTFDREYVRNTFDINAIPVLRKLTHLPVIADPSHGTGVDEFVAPIAKASVAAGASGVMLEVHPSPEDALSDGAQSLNFKQFLELMEGIRPFVIAAGMEM